ncbi:MAG: hypothetical protein AB7G93_22815 [Bdellovibrionales bacterium]
MVDRAAALIDEIRLIKAQYVAEVSKGRRVWPKSIKSRVAELDELGPAKHVAEHSGIPYETVILWRYKRRQAHAASGFHEVKVASAKLPAASKSVTVTAANLKCRYKRELALKDAGSRISAGRRSVGQNFGNLSSNTLTFGAPSQT